MTWTAYSSDQPMFWFTAWRGSVRPHRRRARGQAQALDDHQHLLTWAGRNSDGGRRRVTQPRRPSVRPNLARMRTERENPHVLRIAVVLA